ncbi:F-box protein At4g22280-like isoform X2 [Carex rostrata]
MMNIKAQGSEGSYGIDRISSLPDDVRTHILSFLSTREAVQTCILSKRWINTWASVQDLKFDILDFRFYFPRTQAVADYIGDVMKLGPRACLVKMGLCENLNLNMDAIFTCASLIHLQLQLCLSVEVNHFEAIEPNSVNLSCLKTLDLDGVTMSDDSLKKLLLGCPVLEVLVLQNCYISIIEICSNTLKKLILSSGYHIMRLHISTPNLVYLNIIVSAMGKTLLLNMPSLVDASIYIPGLCDQGKYVTRLPKLIHSLSNVESLRLDYYWSKLPKVLKKDFSDCLMFNNLKRLELVNMGLHDFDLASFFLHHSPKLQELTINNICAWKSKCLEITKEGPRDALVQREYLQTVRISGHYRVFDQLINKLLAHVKIIGEIHTPTRTLSMVTWGSFHA